MEVAIYEPAVALQPPSMVFDEAVSDL